MKFGEIDEETDYRKLANSVHYAPQHPLTHHFMWPTISWLSHCHFHFVLIPLTVTVEYLEQSAGLGA